MELTHPAKNLDTITKEIHACILEGTRRFLMIGKLLKQVQDDQLWALSGCDVLTFLEWAEKEIRWKRAQVYNAMACWERFGALMAADQSLLEIEPTRLIRLLPLPDAVEHLHDAATLTAGDFENHLKDATGKQPTDDGHEHDYEPWLKCKSCHKFIKGAI
jgi:hypothetical protein